jgi:alkanesulfonate monooxygenase SsuD/methylene tetrahydromethanopterin reductase-like flavin-dependent oxidoreductase (luciferase family)
VGDIAQPGRPSAPQEWKTRMKIGFFDHVEMAGKPLPTTFSERIRFVQEADRAGVYCYHVAEHHATPLNSVPVPGVWLGAIAQATKQIRLGPLVYLLPLYSPLRLAEEIAILDNLSGGRFEIGVGRGVSPFELNYHKVDHEKSRDIFFEAYDCLMTALTGGEKFSFNGERYQYKDVPTPLRCVQEPTPPVWYGSSNTTGSLWAGEHGMNFVTNGPTKRALENINAFREGFAKRGGKAMKPKAEFKEGLAIGALRQIVVADTEAEARRIAEPANKHHHANITWLMRLHRDSGLVTRLNVPLAGTYEDARKDGTLIAGTPDMVREEIEKLKHETGINYLISYPFFGQMDFSDAMRSLTLFTREVMPKIRDL